MLNSDRHLNIHLNRQLDGSGADPEIVTELSIAQSQAMPIFTEAVAQAALLLEAPLAILTTIGAGDDRIAAIAGIEHPIDLPPDPNLSLELAGLEYCHERAISSSKFVAIDCHSHPQLAQSPLVRVHGMRAYLGVPIITAARDRLGTLAILDVKPRQFSDREVDLLQLVSSLVASEFERTMLSQAQLTRWLGKFQYRSTPGFDDRVAATEHLGTAGDFRLATAPAAEEPAIAPDPIYPHIQGEIQFKLLTHLARELRTPLTSILGMASVLQQEIYGELSHKQKDYLGIIHHSGQQLVAIVDEISQLGEFAPLTTRPATDLPDRSILKSVDLEMLCQLALQSLEPLAQKKHQHIAIDLAGNVMKDPQRIWLLDKEKVRQIIYYLCLSALHASKNESRISIELVNLTDAVQLQIGTDDLDAILPPAGSDRHDDRPENADTSDGGQDLRISLGLSLSYLLALAHGGKIELSADLHGYELTLPLEIAPQH
jgi:signal transduction histidine kinase